VLCLALLVVCVIAFANEFAESTACTILCRSCRRLRIGSRLRSLRQLLPLIQATPPIAAFDLDLLWILLLILGAPSNHAGRNTILRCGVNRQGCRFSRPRPWMAVGGGPTPQCRITGMPSLGEGPSGGARALWLLSRFSKVTRCKSGTIGGRYCENGYVHKKPSQIPTPI
jgi:hypothetical protein